MFWALPDLAAQGMKENSTGECVEHAEFKSSQRFSRCQHGTFLFVNKVPEILQVWPKLHHIYLQLTSSEALGGSSAEPTWWARP